MSTHFNALATFCYEDNQFTYDFLGFWGSGVLF